MDPYKTTHETDWRRVRWVYDNEYQNLVEMIDEPDEDEKAVAQRELEDLQSGKLVCLGAIVETKCPHCKEWTHADSLWNIIIQPDDDLEELGSEILEIPETAAPVEVGCPNPEVLEMMADCGLKVEVTEFPPPSEASPSPTEMMPPGSGLPLLSAPPKPRGPGLARIVLQFDPDTLANLRSAVFVRALTGNAGGLLDAFTSRLIEKIAAGEAVWEVKQKKGAD